MVHIDEVQGSRAVSAVLSGISADGGDRAAPDLATATRYLLQILAAAHPGHAVEVRVPPFGAVQIGEGVTHRRGTPPNVVEMDAETWVLLAVGRLSWAEAVATPRVQASGVRADLSTYLPLREW